MRSNLENGFVEEDAEQPEFSLEGEEDDELTTEGVGFEDFEEGFEEAARSIREKKHFNSDDVGDFFTQYGKIADKFAPKRGCNLLHKIVGMVQHTESLKPGDVELIVRRLVEKHPTLLEDHNRDNQNPIFMAIRNREHAECLDIALKMKSQKGQTCLHVAFQENLDSKETLKMLIESASDEALAVQDDTGKTPMHYAVSLTNLRAEFLDVFIERDLSAIRSKPRPPKTFLDLHDRQGDPRHAAFVESGSDRTADRDGSTGVPDAKLDDREELRQKKKAEELRRKIHEDEKRNGENAVVPEETEYGARNGRTSERDGRGLGQEPSESVSARIHGRDDAGLQQDPRVVVDELVANSNAILPRLKLHYMRTRSAEMAISFLYGTNMDDIQISFDYDSLPPVVFGRDFEERFGADIRSGFKYDSVLQYVTFPHVEVQQTGRHAEEESEQEGESQPEKPLGRKDMVYFFSWLYRKGVRHIIRVSVEDSPNPSGKVHSDQSIQESLERFVVECLDWKKMDLDPETILHVSSKVEKEAPGPANAEETGVEPARPLRELYLRWSGNNVVLRGWNEREGLAMLPNLERIYLVTPPPSKTHDSPEWINKKVEQFRTRLNAHRRIIHKRIRDLSVHLVISTTDEQRRAASSDTAQPPISGSVDGINSHQWLTCTDRFATEMELFWTKARRDFLQSRRQQGTVEEIEDPVVVALIDDGVDIFDFHNGKVRRPYSSAMGHGTVMASMILRVCPMAKVYPIRLKTYDTVDGKNRNIDVSYAAQAIQAALDKKATIISMSWTLPSSEIKPEAKKRLDDVLELAIERGVLMFYGTVFRWTPENITYALPGVDVVKEQATSSSSRFGAPQKEITQRLINFKYETGSSVATALAAGLAAMILYCVKAAILVVKTVNQTKASINPIPDDGASQIANPTAMKLAFASLGRLTENKFIQVWDELDSVADILRALNTLRDRGATPDGKSAPDEVQKYNQRFVEFGQKLWDAKTRQNSNPRCLLL
ncbi:hypothetical protein MFIFM68171_00936 [Madurella fahalii]|uniref:Peptidase S8/S53 domain-containing protein n=1 Tax=Madurella fahalii TaxID=1157608 RepID=A0ABQ0FYZ4_9PEZI